MTQDKEKNKHTFSVNPDEPSPIPPLNEAIDESLLPGLHEALAEFTTQAQIYFPQILDDERDQAAVKIHLDNLQEQISRTNNNDALESDKVKSALNALLKIGDKKQDDMMACALLDYIDEILEMIN